MTIMCCCILFVSAIAWAQAPAGILSTVAGNGVAGYSGDGGPAAGASLAFAPTRQEPGQPDINEFDQFMHLAMDQAGNLYIADNGNGRIRRVDRKGVITTYFNGR